MWKRPRFAQASYLKTLQKLRFLRCLGSWPRRLERQPAGMFGIEDTVGHRNRVRRALGKGDGPDGAPLIPPQFLDGLEPGTGGGDRGAQRLRPDAEMLRQQEIADVDDRAAFFVLAGTRGSDRQVTFLIEAHGPVV